MKRTGNCTTTDWRLATNTRALPLLVFLAMVFSAVAFAQTKIDPVTGEQVIEIQVAPSDFAAKGMHHYAHTTGALRPDGTRHPPKTFTTDATGALVEVTGRPQALANAVPAAVSPSSIGAPPFTGPGFYPADLSLVSNTGTVVTKAQIHNVYMNCTADCWGNPGVFEKNLFSSKFIHVVDQYVGSDDDGRYTLGPSLFINNYPITLQLVTAPMLNYADLDAILHASASKFGSGYSHIYNIFIPKGVDFCDDYAPPYTFCVSPDSVATWQWCAEHGFDSFTDIPGIELATVQPYPDVFGIYNGQPFYNCDVGQPAPNNSNTSPTPNGVLVDSLSSLVSHELFETITDPDGLEWQATDGFFGYTQSGVEIADVCEIHYGNFLFTPFNISGRLYEIMPEYSNKYHACVTVP